MFENLQNNISNLLKTLALRVGLQPKAGKLTFPQCPKPAQCPWNFAQHSCAIHMEVFSIIHTSTQYMLSYHKEWSVNKLTWLLQRITSQLASRMLSCSPYHNLQMRDKAVYYNLNSYIYLCMKPYPPPPTPHTCVA